MFFTTRIYFITHKLCHFKCFKGVNLKGFKYKYNNHITYNEASIH